MNLLFSKTRSEKYLILFILTFLSTEIHAIDNISDPAFIEKCNNSDAYLIHSYVDVSYSPALYSYNKKVALYNKVVIRSKTGVEEFSFLNMDNFVRDHLEWFSIKLLKSDGTVVEIDSSRIFEDRLDNNQQEHLGYPIPGVEPGDTIETYFGYTADLPVGELKDYLIPYNRIPALKMEYVITTTPGLEIRYKLYNGFPEPQIVSNDTMNRCLFKMEEVSSVSENEYMCLPCELPFVYCSVDSKGSEPRTWTNIYNEEFNMLTKPLRVDHEKAAYYNRWKKKVIGEARDSSKYYKFELLYDEILNNFLMKPGEQSEAAKSSGYFLKKEEFDPVSIRRLYRQLLEDLEIEYWAVFGRSKQNGQIDPYFIRLGEFDHIFFAYRNEQGNFNLLYPHDISYKYQINEIPTSLFKTQAVIVKPDLTEKEKRRNKFIDYDFTLAEADSVSINIIEMPGMTANSNYMKQVAYCDVDANEKRTGFRSKITVSGGLSTDIRSFISLLNQNKEMNDFYDALAEYEGNDNVLEIDTVTEISFINTKPFIYSINTEGTLNNTLTFLNDSLVSIDLGALIQHINIESDKETVDLNYYLDYCYTDFSMFVLSFPSDIEVMSMDAYQKSIDNSVGGYSLNLSSSGHGQIIIQSNYQILKDFIPADEYWQLRQLNDLLKEVRNMRLLIKLKTG